MRRRPVKSGVKDGSSTIAVPLILMGLNGLEVGGMRQVAVARAASATIKLLFLVKSGAHNTHKNRLFHFYKH